MPLEVLLTQEEQIKLKTHRECGVSNRKISNNIGSEQFCQIGRKLWKNKKRLVASKSMFASEVKRELDLPVGIRCIQQVLQFAEYLKYVKRQWKPHLTKQKKRIQTEFGQEICIICKLE